VLDRLDEIPWQTLHHAYGSAEDVPGLLRGLARPQTSEESLYELFGNIWHQGTVYEATSYAVPFFFELAAEPSVPRRDEILGLIGSLADGKSYLDVHAAPDLKHGAFWRQKPDFEERLQREKDDVQRTRDAVLQHRELVCRMLTDGVAMVRAAAGYVLSRFPERGKEFEPLLRRAIAGEDDPLALAALLWCLGAIGNASPEAEAMLVSALRESVDPRQAFAAAVALYRPNGARHPVALPIYRQMAAAEWFAESFMVGVPWDFSADAPSEQMVAEVEPDPIGATQTLLLLMANPATHPDAFVSIVHDLIALNFEKGEWRRYKALTSTQAAVLRSLVETDAAWRDTKRLWFLVPDGARRISQIKAADIQSVRLAMRSTLAQASVSS